MNRIVGDALLEPDGSERAVRGFAGVGDESKHPVHWCAGHPIIRIAIGVGVEPRDVHSVRAPDGRGLGFEGPDLSVGDRARQRQNDAHVNCGVNRLHAIERKGAIDATPTVSLHRAMRAAHASAV